MDQKDKTSIERSETLEALYNAIEKSSAASEDESQTAYREARNILIRFRKVYPKLPALPSHQQNAAAGLQEVMDWCVRAIEIVDHMVDDMDSNVIDGFILKLKELKGIPAHHFPKIRMDVWEKAKDRAQRILDKYEAGKKPPEGLSIHTYCRRRTRLLEAASIISRLVEVANRRTRDPDRRADLVGGKGIHATPLSMDIHRAHTEMEFARVIERIYRLMDADYTTALANLEEHIFGVFEEWNTLNASATGTLLDKYEKLKGLKFQDRLDRVACAYSIDSIVDTALFGSNLGLSFAGESRDTLVDGVIETLRDLRTKIKEKSGVEQSKNGEKAEGSMPAMWGRSSKDNWEAIESDYGVSKKGLGTKMSFVSDPFKRKIIFRDVEHAFVLASQGFPKPALILAGGVIEELLRLYLEHKNIRPKDKRFVDYVKACEDHALLKRGVSRLTDSIRDFRNLVHLGKEETSNHTVSKAMAKAAVASMFTIANDFQS